MQGVVVVVVLLEGHPGLMLAIWHHSDSQRLRLRLTMRGCVPTCWVTILGMSIPVCMLMCACVACVYLSEEVLPLPLTP
jgi:hypothetical protein